MCFFDGCCTEAKAKAKAKAKTQVTLLKAKPKAGNGADLASIEVLEWWFRQRCFFGVVWKIGCRL